MTNDSAIMPAIMAAARMPVRFKSPSTSLYSSCQLAGTVPRGAVTVGATGVAAAVRGAGAVATGLLYASGGRFSLRCRRDFFDIMSFQLSFYLAMPSPY